MATAGCNCNGRIGNTGYPGVKPFGVTAGLYMMPILANDGTRNGIDLTSNDLGQALLDGINNPDPSKRIYPFNNLRNVTFEEADPNFETADNGERFKTRNGIKTVTFEAWGVNEQFFAKASENCVNFGIFLVDVCGNVKGQLEEALDLLAPRPVNQFSFFAKYMDATADTGAKVMFSMDYSLLTSDGGQWMIPDSLLAPYSALELNGLIDVDFDITVNSATQITFQAKYQYGNAVNRLPWRGALIGDFDLYNDATNATVTISSLAESTLTPGEYLMTFPAQTTGDNLILSAFRAASGNLVNGFEGEATNFTAQ
jgi:hypothetical protein